MLFNSCMHIYKQNFIISRIITIISQAILNDSFMAFVQKSRHVHLQFFVVKQRS